MFEAMAMGLVLFFAALIAGLGVAFVGLCAIGVPAERIGRGIARVLRVPGLRRFAAFSRRHRKAVGITGTVLAVGLAPFALAGTFLVIVTVVAAYVYGHLARFDDAEASTCSGCSDVVSYDETDEERMRRWTDEELGLYDG